jgi:succinate dehydrogenase / fumarate reductase iron-sulfur subunit
MGNSAKNMNLTLQVWRQNGPNDSGRMEQYSLQDISPDISFLEMLDTLNEELELSGKEPIAFDHDCREGICGMCGAVVNGVAHGSMSETTLCQLHMRHFNDGDTIYIEPFRAKAFPVIKDLMVDRGSFDRIIEQGGYVSVRTGSAPDANALPIQKDNADAAFDAAACIGCGACVAACPNSSAMLFVSAKVSHLALLPQGEVEREKRTVAMIEKMDDLGFGNCSNHRECEAVCPKGIKFANIARLNREYVKASV